MKSDDFCLKVAPCDKVTYWLSFLSLFFVDAVFRVRDYSDKDIDFQIVAKLLVFGVLLVYSLINAQFVFFDKRRLSSQIIMFLLLYFLVTTFWSESSLYGLLSMVSMFSYFLFIGVVIRKFGPGVLFDAFLSSAILFFLLSFAAYFLIPELGKISYWEYGVYVDGGRMSGIAGSANNLGRYACFAFVICFFMYLNGGRSRTIYLVGVLSILALLLSVNRSSMLMLALGVSILAFRKSISIYYYCAFLFGVFSLFVLFIFPDEILRIFSRSGEMEEIFTFTGRTNIWRVVLEIIAERPFFGHGYGSGVSLLSNYIDEIGFSPSHAHNLFLQILLYGGYVGLFVFIFSIGVIVKSSSTYKKMCVFLIFFVVYNGLLESGAFGGVVNITSVALFISVFLSEIKVKRVIKSNC